MKNTMQFRGGRGFTKFGIILLSAIAFAFPTVFSGPGGIAEAKTLKHRSTGFRVRAPKGFRLKHSRGIYTIKKRRESATVMRVSSPMNNKSTAKSLAKGARIKRAKFKGGGSRTVITGLAKGKPVYIEVKGRGPVFKISKFVTPGRGSRSRSAKMSRTLSARDVAILRRIANSARGGIRSPLAPAIPTRTFRSGGTFARVPNVSGWRYLGEAQGLIQGMVQGSREGQGFFALGSYNLGATGDPNPGNAVINVWPVRSGLGMTVTSIEFIPGTYVAGVSGSGQARYTVRCTINGVSYDAVIFSQTIPNQSGFGYDWYASYVAVRTGSFPGLGNALWNTWTSWNHDASQASRNAQTLATIRSTPVVAINRDAFDRIQDAWVNYIRR